VKPLAITDFTNDWGYIAANHSSSIQAFLSLAHITLVLAEVLDGFYAIQNNSSTLSKDSIKRLATTCREDLALWATKHMFSSIPQTLDPNGVFETFLDFLEITKR
jgi:hypothetical protein